MQTRANLGAHAPNRGAAIIAARAIIRASLLPVALACWIAAPLLAHGGDEVKLSTDVVACMKQEDYSYLLHAAGSVYRLNAQQFPPTAALHAEDLIRSGMCIVLNSGETVQTVTRSKRPPLGAGHVPVTSSMVLLSKESWTYWANID
jgi:hypothetical protein